MGELILERNHSSRSPKKRLHPPRGLESSSSFSFKIHLTPLLMPWRLSRSFQCACEFQLKQTLNITGEKNSHILMRGDRPSSGPSHSQADRMYAVTSLTQALPFKRLERVSFKSDGGNEFFSVLFPCEATKENAPLTLACTTNAKKAPMSCRVLEESDP